jgi:trk system potassium uptake protein TrkA
MGVPRVIAKAISFEQGSVLEKIGAEVIYPESDMAIRLAHRLMSSTILDSIELNDSFKITEFKLTSKLANQTVEQADLRNRFRLNIIALDRDGSTDIEIRPDQVLRENDRIVVIGKNDNLKKFETFLLKH